MQHFIRINDVSTPDLRRILEMAADLRRQREAGTPHVPVLEGKTLAMLLEKPSLRTRVSFEVAVRELGGSLISLRPDEVGLGQREPVADAARVLGGMVHGLIARVFEHHKLEQLAEHSGVPVINALSDRSHPCQALADAMTIIDEFGADVAGRTVVFVGDGNNVAHSLAAICARLGMRFTLVSPEGFELPSAVFEEIRRHEPSAQLELVRQPGRAVIEADVVYTDTWVSMGQEEEAARRNAAFEGFQVNEALLQAAPAHAIVMHCMPAHRNCEITDAVIDGPRSRVIPQAHNRLHAQKGLLGVLYPGG